MTPKVSATAVAVPEHRITQKEIIEISGKIFGKNPHLERLLKIFENAGVAERYFSFPIDYYLNGRTFAQRNRDYIEQAKKLGARVIEEALERSGSSAREIDQFFFVTTTGLATPSIEAMLATKLGFRSDVKRYPLFGLGCAGGAASLGRAAESFSGKTLILSVELCGQTFLNRDVSVSNMVGAALFGEGAAAVILDGEAPGPEIISWGSEIFEGTEEVMGWEFLDEGFKLVLSQSVPEAIRTHVAPALKRFLDRNHFSLEGISHFLLHPGGAKVLDAYQSSLGADLQWTRKCLRNFGNLSSASVFFILHDLLASGTAQKGDLGLLVSVGPGFAMEASLLRWG